MEGILDPNNNASGEKSYSLRPRSLQKKDDADEDVEESWRPRGRTKRRSKQKTLPLSKYRRKTANARERSRMREINDAFESLRKALPHYNISNEPPNEKTTKIMTLRLAMKYISALNLALGQGDLDSDGESLISDYGFNPSSSGRENSLTPSSVSEHSDIFDQLFVNSSLEDYSLSSSSVSPFLSENLKSPNRTLTPSSSLPSSTNLISLKSPLRIQLSKPVALSSSDTFFTFPSTIPVSKPSRLPSYDSLLSTPVQGRCPTPLPPPVEVPDYETSSWREFDCLPSSPVNLDDLFIS